jgi:hypothetical protein
MTRSYQHGTDCPSGHGNTDTTLQRSLHWCNNNNNNNTRICPQYSVLLVRSISKDYLVKLPSEAHSVVVDPTFF